MSKYIPGNQKHLSLEDRTYIENKLNKGESFKNIAQSPTSINQRQQDKQKLYPRLIEKK